MRSRQTLLEQFSTFLQFEGDSSAGWAIDARLRRSMQKCLESSGDSQTSEIFWAAYWHKQWQANQMEPSKIQNPHDHASAALPLGHLSAHLQEPCYWVAQKASLRLDGGLIKVSDCFQVAIASVPKILKAFDSAQVPSLKTYATAAFSNAIRDELRQRREVDRCNDWGLLLKLSRKQLIESLEQTGFLAAERDRYLLAWSCLTSLYKPQKAAKLRQLKAPDAETWGAIARFYNQQRQSLAEPGAEASAATLERWLVSIAQKARAYLYPAVTSLNASRPGQDSGEIQDELPNPDQDSLLGELIADEERSTRQDQRSQINTVLTEAIATLDPVLQELLHSYYQQGLTQQQIAKQQNLPQYAVSRKLTKARESLLRTFTQWSEATLHISLTSNVVNSISIALEEWLQTHFQAE
jgi:RNA polymerase sigma factor (sigma-70 family)